MSNHHRFVDELTTRELTEYVVDWYRASGSGRDQNGLRFGQWLCNNFLMGGETFPELYYTEDTSEAFAMAVIELELSK